MSEKQRDIATELLENIKPLSESEQDKALFFLQGYSAGCANMKLQAESDTATTEE